MATPESELYDLLKELFDNVNANVSSYGGLGLSVIGAFFLFKFVTNRLKKNTGTQTPDKPAPTQEENTGDSSENSGSSGGNENTRAEKEKISEEDRKKQESLEELFALFASPENQTDKKERLQKKLEEEKREAEELGAKKELAAELRAKIDRLIEEIAALSDRGLKKSQIAKTLTARQGSEIPMMELIPMIDALSCFLNEQKLYGEKETFVIGVDPDFERKAAYSALLRGDYEEALNFLERAAEKQAEGLSSRRGDFREQAKREAAELYQAIGVLARPYDMERSFDALQKAASLQPDNELTSALIARTYYESGKPETAVGIFKNISENHSPKEPAFISDYAFQMIPAIRTEAALIEAARIRNDYEHRLDDWLGGREMQPEKDRMPFRFREDENELSR